MSSWYYSGEITVPKEQMDKANEILEESKLNDDLCIRNGFKSAYDDAVFDIGEATGYSECFNVTDQIEELFEALLDTDIHANVHVNYTGDWDGAIRNRGDKLLYLDVAKAGVFDASDKELIDDLKARDVWQKYVKEESDEC